MVNQICPNCFLENSREPCVHCGYSNVSYQGNPMLLPPGTVLFDRYLLGRVLGAGGFGITYLAKDQSTGQRVAVKEYLPSMLAVRDSQTRDVFASSRENQEMFLHGRDMFLKEADILRLFLGDERIVQVMDSFCVYGTAYFVMEYLEGAHVKLLMKTMGDSLPVSMASEILIQAARALEVVHQKGLLHRDVSPENMIVTRDGGMKLIDFGATRFFMGEKSRSLSVILKPGFAPPEQYSSKGNQGAWTDVYALCATIWHVLCGRPVPDASSRIGGETLPSLPREAVLGMPGLERILTKGMDLDYRNRYQTMTDLLLDLHRRHAHTPSPAPLRARHGGNPYIRLFRQGNPVDKWAIPDQMEMVIGRSSDKCNIVIDEPDISRVHCRIHYQGQSGDFYITDQSSNGTIVRGQRLETGKTYCLPSGTPAILAPGKIAIEVGVE